MVLQFQDYVKELFRFLMAILKFTSSSLKEYYEPSDLTEESRNYKLLELVFFSFYAVHWTFSFNLQNDFTLFLHK